MAEEMSRQPFKVIIAGGSISGLTLANALERANIDYVLLEKRDVAPHVGQSIFVLPCTSLVFDQLGINKLNEVAIPLKLREHYDSKMNLFCTSDELWLLYQAAQRPVRFVDRYSFLSGLYGGIRDKSKVHSREGVVSFVETPNGVTVRTDKGNVYEGSILIGADGVHSEVRKQVSALIQKSDPKASNILSTGFKSRYACLTATSWNHFANDPKRPFLADGNANNSYHEGWGVGGLSVAGVAGQIFWSAYIKLDEPRDAYPSPTFTQEDVEAWMKKCGHLKFCPDYSFNDLYKSLVGANMITMEENVLPTRWSLGRVVMIGDAVHKATANLGMGGNLCVDDVCRLVNGLLPLLKRTNNAPTTQEVTKLFSDYERAGRPRAKFVWKASGIFCGFETMSKWYARFIKAIFPWIPSSIKMRVFSIFDSFAPKFDFLPVPPAKFEG